jgi:Wall-associated receptor kinase galacturonan-binding
MLGIALLISYYPPILVLGKSKDCLPLRCSEHGPTVRYPFRLDTHPPHCGYDTLILSCSNGNTVLRLNFSDDYNVTAIDYKNTVISITRNSWTPNCPWSQLTEPNVTGSLFILPYPENLDWFDCPDKLTSFSKYEYIAGPISCRSSEGHFSYVADSYVDEADIPSTCTKTGNSTVFLGPSSLYELPDVSVHQEWVYQPSSPSEFQHVIRDFAARPVSAMYWNDTLINCSKCEKKWRHHCAFDLQTKISFCQGKLII